MLSRGGNERKTVQSRKKGNVDFSQERKSVTDTGLLREWVEEQNFIKQLNFVGSRAKVILVFPNVYSFDTLLGHVGDIFKAFVGGISRIYMQIFSYHTPSHVLEESTFQR